MISIIVPVYKVEKYLSRCVESILSQTYADLEVILVDDGSPDRSGEICDGFAKMDSRIRVIHKANGGIGDARNAGLVVAQGEFIGFVDSDDYIDSDMYEYLHRCITAERADVAVCGMYHCYAGKEIRRSSSICYEVTDRVGAIRSVMQSRATSASVVNKLFRREMFDGLKFRTGVTAEDAFLIVDLLSRAERVVISGEQKYYYFHRSDSITTKPLNDRCFDTVDAYEYNRKRCEEISPLLSDASLFRQCSARINVLDKMMLTDSGYNHDKQEEYIAFLSENLKFILSRHFFDWKRRVALIVLMISRRLYRRMVRCNAARNRTLYE